jgi:hypothetical protein
MVFVQSFDEIANVRSHDLDIRLVDAANFLSNPWFVLPLLQQFKDFRTDRVESEHSTVTDVEKDSSI